MNGEVSNRTAPTRSNPGVVSSGSRLPTAREATELDSLIRQLENHRAVPKEDQAKEGRQALLNLQSGLRSQYGDNERGNQLLIQLQQLLRAPARMLPSRGANQGGHVIRQAMRTAVRRAAAITERGPASFIKSLEPFVSRLAADRVPR